MKKTLSLIVLLLVAGFVAVACSTPAEVVEVTRVVTETEVVEVPGDSEETVVEVTRVVTETVTETVVEEVIVDTLSEEEAGRTGGWLDTIVIIEEPNADAGVARLIAGDLDVYADDVGGQPAINALEAENIETRTQYGLFDELTFNVGTCQDENQLNPFQNNNIRVAMNWAIDREFIADELYNGLAVPKYTTIAEAGADRSRFAAEIRAIENEYGYDIDRAVEAITAEMEDMGATLEDGLWTYNGEPVAINFLIRIEDTRQEIGNYIANTLEDMGFTVERTIRTSGELSPLWLSGDPSLCEWHLYTGAWSQSAIDRESTFSFEQYYTDRVLGFSPLWQLYEPPAELDEYALRVFNTDFASVEERNEVIAAALPLSMEYAPRLWLTSRLTVVPFSTDVSVATDLAGGISGSAIWARTIRQAGEVGGVLNIGLPSVFTQPWNPVGGSNWVFDAMVQRGVADLATYSDPSTGLAIPNRIERAELVVREGYPMGIQDYSDWLTLEFASEVVVPDDAWASWDAENQVFLTAAEVYTETQTSLLKSTVYYPEDLNDTLTWHDGSAFSAADIVMVMIGGFDLADPASPYYDESLVPGLQQFLSAFKGVRIASVDPLVIETWTDAGSLDAENAISTWWPQGVLNHGFGTAAWHNMALMLRGEASGAFAFTADKSEANEIERTNLVAGPSLEVLATELAAATEENFIPYAATMAEFISEEEAAARYANLAEFVRRYGHYYVATGPYFLSGVFPVEGQAVLSHYAAHPDAAARYSNFAAPALAEVQVDGPGRVTIGDEATFDVFIDVFDGPYPTADIASVQYLVFDAEGNLAGEGLAEAVEDGLWEVTLTGDVTGALIEGSSSIDVVAVSNLVALPGLSNFEFVAAP